MPVEERRKRLMETNTGTRWGDVPQALAHVPTIPTPRESPDADHSASDDYDDAFSISDMNKIIEPRPKPPKLRISTFAWSLSSLISSGERFRRVPRLDATSPNLEAEIKKFEKEGIPTIIGGWQKHKKWPKFHVDQFGANDLGILNCISTSHSG